MTFITQAYAFCLKGPKTGKMAQKNLANTYKKTNEQKNPRNPTVFGFIALTVFFQVPVNGVKESCRLQVSWKCWRTQKDYRAPPFKPRAHIVLITRCLFSQNSFSCVWYKLLQMSEIKQFVSAQSLMARKRKSLFFSFGKLDRPPK